MNSTLRIECIEVTRKCLVFSQNKMNRHAILCLLSAPFAWIMFDAFSRGSSKMGLLCALFLLFGLYEYVQFRYWRKEVSFLRNEQKTEQRNPRNSDESYRTTIAWMRAAYLGLGDLA